jgi:thioredoxin 1
MINLTDDNFDKEISSAQKPVLVDFWAVWCGPCSFLAPVLEKLSEEYKEKIIFAKVNIDDSPVISQKLGIDRIPNVVLFKNGKVLGSFVGAQPEEIIKKWLEGFLKNGDDGESSKLIREYEEYSLKNGFKLNPDKKIVEGIVKSLLDREKKFGDKYCPCRRITGDKEEDKKIICPCIYHKEEIEKDSFCLCRLFVKT